MYDVCFNIITNDMLLPVVFGDSGEEQDAGTGADHRRAAAEGGQGERAGTGAPGKH